MRLGYINGLRGLAILGVVWHHMTLGLLSNGGQPTFIFGIPFRSFPVFTQFWKGVDLFFILSGFVLYLPFVMGERRMEDSQDAQRFYQRRARRLMPLFLFAFLLIFSLQHKYPVSNERFYLELFGVPTLLYQFSNLGFIPPSFGPLWSVGVEILFSALFPLLIMLRTRLSMSQILAASLALSIVAQLSSHLFAYRGLQLGLPQHLFNFALGMAACEVVSRPAAFPNLAWLLDWITPFLPLPLLAALLVLSIKDTASSHMVANLIFSFSVTGLVIALGIGKAPVLCRLLENPRLQLIGAMCYSIYLWHVPMLLGLFPGFATNTDWHAVVPYAPLYLALLFAVSALSYRYIEFPNAEVRSLFFLGAKPTTLAPRTTSPLLEPVAAVTEAVSEVVTGTAEVAVPEQAAL